MTPAPLPDWKLPAGVDRGLWNYFHDRPMIDRYDAAMAESPLTQVDIRFCEELFSAAGRLVDLGCGTGRLLVAMARRGMAVTGIDLSDAMLDQARRNLDAAGVAGELLKMNLAELDAVPDASFETAACLFSTYGMVRTAAARAKFLADVRRVLVPGGLFAAHAHNRRYYLGNPGGGRWLLGDLNPFGGDRADRATPAAMGSVPLVLRHFTRGEFVRDLERAGFRVREVRAVRADGGEARGVLGRFRAYGWLAACERR